MSFGLQVNNASGSLLVSDVYETLHFLGKASYVSNDGGNCARFYGYNNEDPQNVLSGRVVYSFTIQSGTPPVVFIKPGNVAYGYGLLREYNSGSTWYFDVIQTGLVTTAIPSLYCFVNANVAELASTGGSYGLQVRGPDSRITFDSRFLPLALPSTGTSTVIVCPVDDNRGCPSITSGHSFRYSNLDWDFTSENKITTAPIAGGIAASNMMFSCPSLGQSVQRRVQNGYKKSCGLLGSPQHHYSTAQWWVIYRNVFRLQAGTFVSGWAPYQQSYQYWEKITESGGFLGISADSGDSSYVTGNTLPYLPKTINIDPNTFMIADALRY